MPRLRPALFALFGLVPAATGFPPSTASAQATTNGLTVSYDDEAEDSRGMLYLNANECESNVKVTFDIRLTSGSIPANSVLQVWEGPTGTDCAAADSRGDGTGGSDCSEAACNFIAEQTVVNRGSDLSIDVKAQELFGKDDGGCVSGTRKVTLVAVSSSGCSQASDDIFSATSTSFTATFTLDTTDAAVPSDVKASDGNSTIRLSWNANGGETSDTYKVYVDTDPGAECGNTMLKAEMEPLDADALADMIDEVQTRSADTTALNLTTSSLNLGDYDYVALAVSSTTAGSENRSALSAVACGQRVPTSGPVSAVEAELDRKVQSCSSGESRASSAGAILLGLAGLWLVRRRESRA